MTDLPIVNFRDFGGPAGADGRHVKQGLLFRGTALWGVSDEVLNALAGLGIGLVYDLRSLSEASGRPDRVPPGATYMREPGVISMDEIHRESLDWRVMMDEVSRSESALAEAETFQYGVYTEMIRCPAAFATLTRQLIDHPGRGTYIHCSAGKDRTGVAAAIVLRLLGVGASDIMDDYMDSARHPQPDVAAVEAQADACGPRVSKLVRTMTGVAPARLNSAFDEARRVWGGWDGFVRDGLGLSRDDVEALQANLLA